MFLDQLITNDHLWSVQMLLDFSQLPGINDALEGDTRIEIYRDHEDMTVSDIALEELGGTSVDGSEEGPH